MSALPWHLIVCPTCGSALTSRADDASCAGCGARYSAHREGGFDLRLQRPRTVSLEFELGTPLFDSDVPEFAPLTKHASPEVDFTSFRLPEHLTPEMASHLPRAPSTTSHCLDLGCGSGRYQSALEHAGYRWVGADYVDKRAPILADAHALPFADGAFDLVVNLAVLEHIRYPHVMMREAFRVLRPGGVLFGTVAYLVPFHLDSFYNMTHYGACSALRHAGFAIERVASDPRYLGVRALAYAGLFHGAPRQVAYAAVAPLVAMHRAWWWLARRAMPSRYDEDARLLLNTGAFLFIARKPLDQENTRQTRS